MWGGIGDTSKEGTCLFEGVVTGYKERVKLNINVSKPPYNISKIDDIMEKIFIGERYSLPTAVNAVLSDGTKQLFPVTWSPGYVDTSKVGTYFFWVLSGVT